MGNRVMMGSSFLFISFFIFSLGFSVAQKSPAVYVFGDSLVDVGNNNYLSHSIEKAILPHYGIDLPTKKPSGRFSNGMNAADLIAEKLGLPTSPPPYLSQVSNVNNKKNVSFLDGVNFASGGAGIFNASDNSFTQTIPLPMQVDYYSQVYEQLTQQSESYTLQKHLSKSIFIVVIGSNDIFGYFDSRDRQKKSTPQQYVNSMTSSLKAQLQRLYNYGARKFEIAGVGTIGCCPAYRLKNKTECVSEANFLSVKYNEGLQSMLKEWQLENKNLSYSYFNTYAAIEELIQNPTSYGFADVKAACCGLGELNAQVPCLPISNLCSNRQDHIFWDSYHPTEAATRVFVDEIFNGPSKYASPINMAQILMTSKHHVAGGQDIVYLHGMSLG
ncbi:GDSL esterase/lipase At5g55050-like isoform X2 [Gastrolobium bilobum]|uniref:GDSL esterase/lipase At5g55050-like isoform X2 n=1 Tax=Gastrolobium bilobum TaxID=150636 RepID=UPI002AB27383|nr:GDSL esterase/lipase At5g55050-like isoform X2 [Gastrolobium bilobum]